MTLPASHRNRKRTGLKLLPYVMFLLPILVINLGFRFLADIEHYWQEREQSETAQQELEALTRSSSFEYQLARYAGSFSDQIETAVKNSKTDDQLRQKIAQINREVFSRQFPAYKLHLFRKSSSTKPAELFFTVSDKVESKRGMALIFDYMLDQHLGKVISAEICKQKDKIAESYFGKTCRSEVFATSQKSRTTYILHEDVPHWFIWDYKIISEQQVWGYFITTRIEETSRTIARQLALTECRSRGNGLGGFISLINPDSPDVITEKLQQSQLFKEWRKKAISPIRENLKKWLTNGSPATVQLGNYRIYTHLGKGTEHLTIFLAPMAQLKKTPAWLKLLNIILITLITILSIRGLLLNRWIETGITLRFLLLYSLAAAFPLGLLTVTAVAYQYQYNRSSQNQTAANIESCLKLFETNKLQIQETYQSISRRLFSDQQLISLINDHGIKSEPVKHRILDCFKDGNDPLPLLGFFLLDLAGKGLEYYEEATPARLNDLAATFQAPIIQKIREIFATANPEVPLPEYRITETEKLSAQAMKSVSGNDMSYEMEKLRNNIIIQKSGNGTASLIYNYVPLKDSLNAALFIAWDGSRLFEKSIEKTITSLRGTAPQFSFIAFRNTPQGIKTFFRENDRLTERCFHNAAKTAQTAATRGSFVKEHIQNFSIAAMPFGQNSEIVIVGISSHEQLNIEKQTRFITFVLLISCSILIAILCAYFTAAFLLKPITELKSALDKVSVGDYSIRLTSARQDELGNLTREFAKMVDGIKERQRLAALLSDHAVEALSTNTGTGAIGCDAREFRGIALVSDIRSFTALCETHQTREIIGMLNDHIQVMSTVIAANGGRIYKFIGDAIEAVFDETDNKDLSENAIKAAIEMQCAQRELNRKRAADGKFIYNSGIGLARGTFFAGSVGSDETRLDYSIIGDTFNRAANFEAATKNCRFLPIAFDAEIAETLAKKASIRKISSDPDSGMTLADETVWVKKIVNNFSMKNESQPMIEELLIKPLEEVKEESFFQRNFKPVAMMLFTLGVIGTGLSIFYGLMIRNQSFSNFYQKQAHEQNLRLAKQLAVGSSGKAAFEMKMKQVIEDIQSDMTFTPQSNEAEVIKKHLAATIEEMQGIGINPKRVYAATFDQKQVKTSFSTGIPDHQIDFFQNLGQYQCLKLLRLNADSYCERLNSRIPEVLGTRLKVDFLGYEKFGAAMAVKNGTDPELFYWNHVLIRSPELTKNGLPDQNHKLINCPPQLQRVAAIIMFAISEEDALRSQELLLMGFAEPGIALSLTDKSGKTISSKGFPHEIAASANYLGSSATTEDFVFDLAKIRINNENYQLCISQRLSKKFQIDLVLIGFIILITVSLLCFYLYRSLYLVTSLTTSIEVKLVFSMLLTAIIPVFTVVFVTDFFLTENHRSSVQQQKLEIQRYLDNFEVRPEYYQPIATRMIHEFTAAPEIHNLARQLDQNPDSITVKNELHQRLSRFFIKIDDDSNWSSNLTTREAILISKNNWVLFHGRNQGEPVNFFAEILSHIGKHILSCINPQATTDNLSMKNLKGEIYYDTTLQSARSNFGNEAFIGITNAINQMVTIEVTTGAAGLIFIPIPSIEKPDFIMIWMISLNRGGYFSRVATHNKGPFAVVSIEYAKYGMLRDKFFPVHDFGLEKVAAWLSSSNQRVSFEQEIGHEKVSIEGSPGVQQIDNFMVGFASQKPIEQKTLTLRRQINQFLLLAILVFLIIGHQTASDIVIPVRALAEGMKQIGLQNYFYRIATERKDELGELCGSYDRFARGLAEKEVMGRMVSKGAQKAISEDLNGETAIGGVKRNFVFIYIGSLDFTSRLKNESSELLFKKLKAQVALLCKIIIAEGGDIDKLMGDKILGVFPVSSEKSEQAYSAAISTAKKIQQAEQQQQLNFPVAIGINAGEVISGMLGFGSKRDFTVIGDAVNVTARIQKEAEKLSNRRCLFSEEFVKALSDDSEFRFSSEAALKGKSATCRLYEYLNHI